MAGWNTTCVPRPVRIVSSLNAINGDLVDQQCNNPECIKSFLQVKYCWMYVFKLKDYDLVVNNADVCTVSPKDEQVYKMYTEFDYQSCKIVRILKNMRNLIFSVIGKCRMLFRRWLWRLYMWYAQSHL